MHSAISLSVAALFPAAAARSDAFPLAGGLRLAGIRFCGLRREALGLRRLRSSATGRISPAPPRGLPRTVAAAAAAAAGAGNGSPASGFDYDLVIIGAGVGGHGAAVHAVENVICFLRAGSVFSQCNYA